MVVAGSTSVSTDQPSYSVELVGTCHDYSGRSTTIDVEVVDETRDPTLATVGWSINQSNQHVYRSN